MAEIYKDFSETNRKLAKKILEEQATERKTEPLIGSASLTSGARAGALLGDMQRKEAALVGKLSKDFPIRQFDSMPTKAQLKAVQNSELTPNERWNLLNLSMPIETLSMLNDIENRVSEQTITRQDAAALTQSAVQLAAEQQELESGNTAYLPPLQKNLLRTELEGRKDVLKRIIETGAPLNYPERQRIPQPSIDEDIAQPPASIPTPEPDPIPDQTPLSQPDPTTDQTPLPQPESSPETTSPEESPIFSDQNYPMDATSADQENPNKYLLGIDTSYLSTGSRKILELIYSKLASGAITMEEFKEYLPEFNQIKIEAEKAIYYEKIKSSPSKATWGTEMIYDQGVYNNIPGTFGPLGNIPEKVCGAVAIHNANQILGFKTRADELIFWMQKYSILSTNVFGLLGVNPDVITGIYTSAGAKVTKYKDTSRVSKEHDAYIVLYYYWLGGHYVAAEYDSKKDCFLVYNNFKTNGPEEWKTLSGSSYAESASLYRRSGKSFGWTVWGIDAPKQPAANTPRRHSSSGKSRVMVHEAM